jgi:hypothetical protein
VERAVLLVAAQVSTMQVLGVVLIVAGALGILLTVTFMDR